MRIGRRLARRDEGVATVEFAFWSVFIFGALVVGFDYGMFSLQQARLERSVSEASNFAFANFAFEAVDDLDADAIVSIGNYVTRSSGLPADQVDVTITCNVNEDCTGSERGWACLEADGTLVDAGSEDDVCGTGAPAGYYLTVRAEYEYGGQAIANPLLNGATMVQVSTVRLR